MEGSGALCVVVQGPGGCGKTSLLKEYVSLCGRTIGDSVMMVHLGEQIDSKVLTCGDVTVLHVKNYSNKNPAENTTSEVA